jgi:hypothetical protein
MSTAASLFEWVYNSCGFQWHQIEQERYEQQWQLKALMLVVKHGFVQVGP